MNRFIEVAGRIGGQRHLTAIRDGFIAIMPLIVIGSLAIVVNNFPAFGKFDISGWLNSLFGEGNWQAVGDGIWKGTFAFLGLLISFSISYSLAKSYEIDALSAGLISVASYIILIPNTSGSGLSLAWLGSQGLFVGIILALVLTELFHILVKLIFTIKVPNGVPIGVTNSFLALIPIAIIFILVGLFQALLNIFVGVSIFEITSDFIQKPLQGLGNTLPAALIVAFLTHLLWFLGLHGTNILGGLIEPLYLPLIEKNLELFKGGMSAYDVPNIVTKPFLDVFVFMGGSGTTLALLIAVFMVMRSARKHPYLEVTKLSAPGALFNINEPVIFGLPIVLNPIMLIPFILVPVVLTTTSFVAIATGFVPKTVAILPWSTPPIISGFLVTGGSWRGSALQIINLITAVIIYLPFIMAAVKVYGGQRRE